MEGGNEEAAAGGPLPDERWHSFRDACRRLEGKYNDLEKLLLSSLKRHGVLHSDSFAQGLESLIEAAARGSVDEQVALGLMCSEGVGVNRDPVTAIEWFRKAADQNHPAALMNLGARYRFGVGVEKDPVKAVEMFRAVVQGCGVHAKYSPARVMISREGEGKDESGGMEVIKRLAEDGKGYEPAISYLALATCKGLHGMEKDPAKAARLYEKAIETKGSVTACLRLGTMFVDGTGVQQDWTKAMALFQHAADGV